VENSQRCEALLSMEPAAISLYSDCVFKMLPLETNKISAYLAPDKEAAYILLCHWWKANNEETVQIIAYERFYGQEVNA
jgi:hypothetical protein